MSVGGHSRRKRILVTARIHDEVARRLGGVADLDINANLEPWPRAALLDRARDCDAMMAFMTDMVDGAFLAASPNLRFIACALKGYDNIDIVAAERAGVGVSIVPDLLTAPTSELAIGLAIALARHVRAGDARVRSGEFRGWRADLYGRGLAGSTIAILGMGRVGQAIAAGLACFGCGRILGVDPQAAPDGVEMVDGREAFARADFVFAALPLTQATRHFVDADLLAASARTPYLINAGRGSSVCEEAVADALASGKLAGYAADVFAFEDWALVDRPDAPPGRLLAHPATLFTPHLGSAVAQVRLAIEQCAADNLMAWIEGRAPPDLLTPAP